MVPSLRWVVFGSLLSLLLTQPQAVRGQSSLEMELSAEYIFGESISFTGKLLNSIDNQSAELIILDETQSIIYTRGVSFDQNGISRYIFDVRESILPPFAKLYWRYEIVLGDGTLAQSQTVPLLYEDDRYLWQSREEQGVHVHWYERDEQFGNLAVAAVQTGLESINTLFEPDLSVPVEIYLYSSSSDLRGVLNPSNEWAVGKADSSVNLIVVTVESGANEDVLLRQRIPHELMHMMLYRRLGPGYNNIPLWLREGLAMLVESDLHLEHDSSLMTAYGDDSLIPIQELCASFPLNIDSAFLAYAESMSFTNYLLQTYGSDNLMGLATVYASGADCEHGTELAFDISLNKLQINWQHSLKKESQLSIVIGRFAPYLALLCFIIVFPFVGIVSSLRRKEGDRG